MRLAVLVTLLACAARAAPSETIATFEDPVGDAYGPGTYTKPLDGDIREGAFDLRRFTVSVEGDDAIFEVALDAPVRRPQTTRRTNETDLQLWSGIYLQNVDIYIDRDHRSDAGYTVCIPGRRVAFPEGQTWQVAVVLTPQPGPARAITEAALGKDVASHVVFVLHMDTNGRAIRARVPLVALGGRPRKDWGYSVHVSGASWERSFSTFDRLRGGHEENAFTMPVLPVPEPWAFGGAPESGLYPRVIDVLLPRGMDQRAVLGAFDAVTPARVPFVYAELPRRAPAPAAAAPAPAAAAAPADKPAGLIVADKVENLVSLTGPVTGVRRMQIGRVLGADGSTVAHVIVVQVLDGGLLTEPIDNADRIQRGARVVFNP